jgi:hypothetical protein
MFVEAILTILVVEVLLIEAKTIILPAKPDCR